MDSNNIENQLINMILDDYNPETIEQAIRDAIKRTLKKVKKNG